MCSCDFETQVLMSFAADKVRLQGGGGGGSIGWLRTRTVRIFVMCAH
jgi:hypothetical protein